MTVPSRCEPPPDWRAWHAHWLQLEDMTPDAAEWRPVERNWLVMGDIEPITPEQAHAQGFRYHSPLIPPEVKP